MQFYGVAATIGSTLTACLIVFAAIKLTIGLRVSEADELRGLDWASRSVRHRARRARAPAGSEELGDDWQLYALPDPEWSYPNQILSEAMASGSDPDVISLAVGWPSPDIYPTGELAEIIGDARAARFRTTADAARAALAGRRIVNVNSTAIGGGEDLTGTGEVEELDALVDHESDSAGAGSLGGLLGGLLLVLHDALHIELRVAMELLDTFLGGEGPNLTVVDGEKGGVEGRPQHHRAGLVLDPIALRIRLELAAGRFLAE